MSPNGQKYLDAGKPWIVKESIPLLASLCVPPARVVEWGSGGSTVFFGRCGAKVVSVESDARWAGSVRSSARKAGCAARCKILVVPPDDSVDPGFESTVFPGSSFRDYVLAGAMELHRETTIPHVVFIDGRCRHRCLDAIETVWDALSAVVLDNSDRRAYQESMLRLESMLRSSWGTVIRTDFVGNGTFGGSPWRTTFWRKPRCLTQEQNMTT